MQDYRPDHGRDLFIHHQSTGDLAAPLKLPDLPFDCSSQAQPSTPGHKVFMMAGPISS
jgi:hypothetical protein